MADRFVGRFAETSYLPTFQRLFPELRLAVAQVDGETALLTMSPDGTTWNPRSIVHIEVSEGRIVKIADYVHCPWVLQSAQTWVLFASQQLQARRRWR